MTDPAERVQVIWATLDAPATVDVLGDEERSRWSRLRDPVAQQRYLVGHTLLRTTVAAAAGIRPAAVTMRRRPCPLCGGPHGRPYAVGLDMLEFSYSASGDVACVALASSPVGIDVEAPVQDAVRRTVTPELHPDEISELACAPPGAFARTWTRKEAYLKALGTGLGRSPAEDYVGSQASRHPAGWTFTDIDLDDRHITSLCTQGSFGPLIDVRAWAQHST